MLQMLANLMFRRSDIDQAIFYFKKLFDKKPGLLRDFYANKSSFVNFLLKKITTKR
jgi:hypothetical protein